MGQGGQGCVLLRGRQEAATGLGMEEKPGAPRGRGGVGQGSPHRLDVSVQEAHGVDGLDGLQDLLAQPQGGAQREGASGLAAAQVSQVPALGGGATLLSGRPTTTTGPSAQPRPQGCACVPLLPGSQSPFPFPAPRSCSPRPWVTGGRMRGPRGLTWSCITT